MDPALFVSMERQKYRNAGARRSTEGHYDETHMAICFVFMRLTFFFVGFRCGVWVWDRFAMISFITVMEILKNRQAMNLVRGVERDNCHPQQQLRSTMIRHSQRSKEKVHGAMWVYGGINLARSTVGQGTKLHYVT